MDVLKNSLDSIKIKAKQLALKVERLEKENEFLNKKLEQFQTKQGKIHIAQASKPSDTLASKTKNQGKEAASIKKLKKEVNQYIKEVEKCIEWVKEV